MTYQDDQDPRSSSRHRSDPRDDSRGSRRDRKERVLHTRISEDLAEDIRRVAEGLRVPVSNLVRNVLEEAVSVVEAVSDDVGDVIEDVVGEAEAARDRIRDRFSERRSQARRRAGSRPSARRRPVHDEHVEAELRRDEAAEARGRGPDDAAQARARGRDGSAGDHAARPDEVVDATFEETGGGVSLDDVIGWQPLVLHRSQPCAQCSTLLKRGEDAFAAVKTSGVSQLLVCPSWVREGRCAD